MYAFSFKSLHSLFFNAEAQNYACFKGAGEEIQSLKINVV